MKMISEGVTLPGKRDRRLPINGVELFRLAPIRNAQGIETMADGRENRSSGRRRTLFGGVIYDEDRSTRPSLSLCLPEIAISRRLARPRS